MNFLNRFVIVFLLIAFQGCSTFNKTKIGPVGVKKGNGLVTFQVITNTERVGLYHTEWDEILLYKVGELKKRESNLYTIKKIKKLEGSVQGFIGQVPEGEYVVGGLWSAFYTDSFQSTIRVPLSFPRSITVKAGHTSNGGTYIYQPLDTVSEDQKVGLSLFSQTNIERSVSSFVGFSNQSEYSTNSLIRAYLAPYKKRKKKVPKIAKNYYSDSHVAAHATQKETELFELSKKYFWPKNVYEFKDAPKIKHQVGKLGLVREIAKNSTKEFQVPTKNSIVKMGKVRDGFIYLSDVGELFWRNQQDKVEKLKAPDKGKVVWIGSYSNKMYLISKLERKVEKKIERKINVYSTDSARNNDWKELGEIKDKKDLIRAVALIDGSLGINLSGVYYHYFDDKWFKYSTSSVDRIDRQKNKTLIASETGFFSNNVAYSFDSGASWNEANRKIASQLYLSRNSLPFVADNEKIYAITSEADGRGVEELYLSKFLKGGVKVKLERSMGHDERQYETIYWEKISPLPESCYELLPTISSLKSIYIQCEAGGIMVTADQGDSWHNYSVISKDGLNKDWSEMKKKYAISANRP